LKFNAIDVAFIAWAFFATFIYVLQQGTVEALKFKLGMTYDAIGLYFVFRCLVRNWMDLSHTVRGVCVIAVPVAVAFAVEKGDRAQCLLVSRRRAAGDDGARGPPPLPGRLCSPHPGGQLLRVDAPADRVRVVAGSQRQGLRLRRCHRQPDCYLSLCVQHAGHGGDLWSDRRGVLRPSPPDARGAMDPFCSS
jgi:hypothetical protein